MSYRAETTNDGRFAVTDGKHTIAVTFDEAAAILVASTLSNHPVVNIEPADRCTEQKEAA